MSKYIDICTQQISLWIFRGFEQSEHSLVHKGLEQARSLSDFSPILSEWNSQFWYTVNTHLNNSVSGSLGALNRMEIPRFIKGLVKSITVSRAWLIVMDATAKSALRSNNCLTIPFQSPLHSELFLRNMIQKKSFVSSKDFSDNFCLFWAPQKLFSSFKNYVKNCWCRKYSRCNDFMGGNQ